MRPLFCDTLYTHLQLEVAYQRMVEDPGGNNGELDARAFAARTSMWRPWTYPGVFRQEAISCSIEVGARSGSRGRRRAGAG